MVHLLWAKSWYTSNFGAEIESPIYLHLDVGPLHLDVGPLAISYGMRVESHELHQCPYLTRPHSFLLSTNVKT